MKLSKRVLSSGIALVMLITSTLTALISTPVLSFAALQTPPSTGAVTSGIYRNLFSEIGKSTYDIENKVAETFSNMFAQTDTKIYNDLGSDMGYIYTGSDVRSEGMSYGMMISVQLGQKTFFDRLWKFAKTYMYNTSGPYTGYFTWRVNTNGSKIWRSDIGAYDIVSAPDGEEYFATALLMASVRWPGGTGIYDYETEALNLLSDMITTDGVRNYTMFNLAEKKVVFGPDNAVEPGFPNGAQKYSFTDPSYHLPAFYDYWALFDTTNAQFWTDCATTSRAYFVNATDSNKGLASDYSNFDGSRRYESGVWHNKYGTYEDDTYSAWDSHRVPMNIALDYSWWAKDPWEKTHANTILTYYQGQGFNNVPGISTRDGLCPSNRGKTSQRACGAVAGLASTLTTAATGALTDLWNLSMPNGDYYGGCLQMLSILMCSGKFKAYLPVSNPSPNGPTIQAENATKIGGARNQASSNAVGSVHVAYTDVVGNGIQFENVMAASQMDLRYATTSSGNVGLCINDVYIGDLYLPNTNGWTNFTTIRFSINVNAGDKIKLKKLANGPTFNVDYITLIP